MLSIALLSTHKRRVIREWGKFCNFTVVCLVGLLGQEGRGVNISSERFALGGLVGRRKAYVQKKSESCSKREKERVLRSSSTAFCC